VPQARLLGGIVLQVEGKFDGMEVSDAKRLKALEEENSKLKRLLADSLLDNAALKDVVSRKW
jgi:putative transposase